MKESLKALIPHFVSIAIILLVITVYFFPQVQGKILDQGDLIQSRAKVQALNEYQERDGIRYLWNPSQFAGMPFLYAVPAKSNLLEYIGKASKLGMGEAIGTFFSLSLFCYILFLFMGVNRWLALGLALATALSTNNIILWKTGHYSKILTLVYTPIIIMGLMMLYDKRKYLLGFGVFSLGLGLSLFARHPQMSYYLFMALLCYGIYEIYILLKDKDWKHFMKASILVILAAALSVGSSASKLWSLNEHKESSMRGGPVLAVGSEDSQSTDTKAGLEWDYAMQWSNGWKDVVATFIPGFVGGGTSEHVGTDSETFKRMRIKRAPLYWGSLPFTEAPSYLGAVMIFLFLFSFLLIKSQHKWWILGSVILIFLLSGGKNFSIVNKFFFDYLPLFSSWRAPSSAVSVAVFLIPLMICLGMKEMLQLDRLKSGQIANPWVTKILYLSLGVTAGLCLIFVLIGSSIFSFESSGDPRYAQQGLDISAFISDRKTMLRNDAFRSFVFIMLAGGLVWLWIKGKVKSVTMSLALMTLMIIDFIGVDLRYLSSSDYQTQRAASQVYNMRNVDEQIKNIENERGSYRVLDVPNFGSSMGSYYHNTIGGYDAVKMRRYQDLIDHHISKNNVSVLNMLNTKYIITRSSEGVDQLQQNPGALGPAWLVNRIVNVNSPNEEIDALSTFDPKEEAVILSSEFTGYLDNLSLPGDVGATIEMVSYNPDNIEYQFSSSSEELAVFSETWFGHDKGWKVTVDDKESEFIRANYDLRAMRIPSGEHTIKFQFRPRSFYLGEKISLLSSGLILLLLGIAIYLRKDEFVKLETPTAPVKRKKKKLKKK